MAGISRRHAMRGAVVAAAGISMLSGLGIAAAPAQAGQTAAVQTAAVCVMETLPVPADTFRSDSEVIDPSGRYIAGSSIVRRATDTYPVLLWDNGQLTQFDAPTAEPVPAGVNRDGVVIGNGRVGALRRPWRYQAGVAAPLPAVDPADEVTVQGINSRGDVVGIGETPAGTAYALLWPASWPGTVRVIGTPADLAGIAGITDDGTIVGWSGSSADPASWLRTPSGLVRSLTGPDAATGASVTAIGGDWAVGQGYQAGEAVALRWDLRTREVSVLDPRLGVSPNGVNAAGTVLAGALLQRGTDVVTLPSPSPAQPVGGRDIADDGTVVGFHNTRLPGGAGVRGVRWTGC